MGRAVALLKRVADPEDPLTYWSARRAMRPRNSKKEYKDFLDRKRAKKTTVAKNKKSA